MSEWSPDQPGYESDEGTGLAGSQDDRLTMDADDSPPIDPAVAAAVQAALIERLRQQQLGYLFTGWNSDQIITTFEQASLWPTERPPSPTPIWGQPDSGYDQYSDQDSQPPSSQGFGEFDENEDELVVYDSQPEIASEVDFDQEFDEEPDEDGAEDPYDADWEEFDTMEAAEAYAYNVSMALLDEILSELIPGNVLDLDLKEEIVREAILPSVWAAMDD
jgi:hypothetical protein